MQVRAKHNGGEPCKVRVACTPEDFDMVQGIYYFTAQLLRNAADGTKEGLKAALRKPYSAQ